MRSVDAEIILDVVPIWRQIGDANSFLVRSLITPTGREDFMECIRSIDSRVIEAFVDLHLGVE
jgi:hypothetical protein